MPVKRDPNQRRRPRPEPEHIQTEEDREKKLADAEWKNLWDATEVLDMDKW